MYSGFLFDSELTRSHGWTGWALLCGWALLAASTQVKIFALSIPALYTVLGDKTPSRELLRLMEVCLDHSLLSIPLDMTIVARHMLTAAVLDYDPDVKDKAPSPLGHQQFRLLYAAQAICFAVCTPVPWYATVAYLVIAAGVDTRTPECKWLWRAN